MEKTVTIPLSEYDYLREQLKQLKEFDKETKKEAYLNEAVQERDDEIKSLKSELEYYDKMKITWAKEWAELTVRNAIINSQLNKLKSRNLWQRILNKC